MLPELASEWTMDLDRGPDWLFIRLHPPQQETAPAAPLAELIWKKLESSFCYRLVLELDELRRLQTWIVGELARLQQQLEAHGGTLRLCGLSVVHEEVLRACHLLDHFPAFDNRHDAVMGHRPPQPR